MPPGSFLTFSLTIHILGKINLDGILFMMMSILNTGDVHNYMKYCHGIHVMIAYLSARIADPAVESHIVNKPIGLSMFLHIKTAYAGYQEFSCHLEDGIHCEGVNNCTVCIHYTGTF